MQLPPLRQIRPSDSGGSIARAGFAFQDHVAAGFCIEMLSREDLKEVWCETYDDIVLVWDKAGEELFEFVQVKAENHDQLWTPALLCQRDKKKDEPEKAGTSIPERSLARDCCCEETCFRLVTSWEVRSELRILKLERGHKDRSSGTPEFTSLLTALRAKIGDHRSAKGHGCDSWLERVVWQVDSQSSLEQTNRLKLLEILEKVGLHIPTDSVGIVYGALLALVKDAAQQPDSKREKKFLKAKEIRAFIREQAEPFPGLGPSEKLNGKLSVAGLPETERETAQELRRAYLKAVRTRSYLETGGTPPFANAVLYQLLRLRTAHDSGEISALDGIGFHALCLKRVEETMKQCTTNSAAPPVELGAGCMYDIAARCQHRFTRPKP